MLNRSVPRGKWRIAIAAVLLLAVVLGAAAIILPDALRPHLPTAAEVVAQEKMHAALTGPARTFSQSCAYCHDSGIGPRLAGLGLPAAVVTMLVRQGPGPMPSFGPGKISDAELAALANYVSALPAPAANP